MHGNLWLSIQKKWDTMRQLHWLGYMWLLLKILIYSIVSIPIIISDLRSYRIPDIYTIIGSLGLVIILTVERTLLVPNLLSGFTGFVILFVAKIIARGLGFGDVKLAIMVGLFSGFPGVLLAVFISVITGILYIMLMVLIKKLKADNRIPFAPFMILGGFSVVVSDALGIDLALFEIL